MKQAAVTANYGYYDYKTGNNRLLNIRSSKESPVNLRSYRYNKTGQLVSEQQVGQSKYLHYDAYGQVIAVYADAAHSKPIVKYAYNDQGYQVLKKHYNEQGQAEKDTWYARDAAGNVLSIYEEDIAAKQSLSPVEFPVYAQGRLGMLSTRGSDEVYQYELNDHLGNVRVVISRDRKSDGSIDVLHYRDYYAYGAAMLGRTFVGDGSYRYGWNSQEKTDEIAGSGNHYTAPFWEYNPSIVHRWNLDPKPHPSFSPYAIIQGNPILYADPLGDTIVVDNKGYITRNNNTDNMVFTVQDGQFTQLGELGKSVDVNTIYKNLLQENSETADGIWKPKTFRELVKGGGEWDFKANDKTIYGLANKMASEKKIAQTQFLFDGESLEAQDIGNHHFGVVGKATGLFPENFMLKRAGIAQMKSGTSKPEWQKYGEPNINNNLEITTDRDLLPPYGDDPRDQKWIKSGFRYYKNNQKSLDGDWF